MAELDFNTKYNQMNDLNQQFYDSYFEDNYDPNKSWNDQSNSLTMKTLGDASTTPDFAAMQAAYADAQKSKSKGSWFTSADAAMPDQTYGLQTNTMGGVTINPDGTLNYNNTQTPPNLGFRSMVDMAADTENFDNQFNNNFADYNMSGPLRGTNTMRGSVIGPDMSIRDYQQAANRYSGMGQVVPNKSDMIGNTIAEAMIDEDRIPGRVQESVPNYQGWFERMMSGVQNKLGGAWGKTKELGSRFKEKAGPVFGLASMFANATNPLNPKSFNYNPGLKGQLDFMDKEMGGWSTTNPNSGLMQYGADTPLAGQNVFSGFGSNDPIAQLEKTLARRQKTYDNLENQWGNTLTAEELEAKKTNYFNKFINPTTNWLGKITEDQKVRIDKKNKALAIKEAEREARREDARNTAKIEAYTGQKMSNYRASRPRSERGFTGHGRSGMGRDPSDKMARGGRVGYGNGGLATLFTRRG